MNSVNDEYFDFDVWYSGAVLHYAVCFFSELWFLQVEILIMWKVEHYWICLLNLGIRRERLNSGFNVCGWHSTYKWQ